MNSAIYPENYLARFNLDWVISGIESAISYVKHGESHPGRSRRVQVPDLIGLPISEARLRAMREGVHLTLVRTQPNPPPVQGVVTLQRPGPETRVRRDSTVSVWLTFS